MRSARPDHEGAFLANFLLLSYVKTVLDGWRARLVLPTLKAGFLVLSTIFWTIQAAGAQELRNFHHTTWSSDGAMGAVLDIQQSPDGYLWLSTSRGVFRFDGARFQTADEITSGATKTFELFSAFVSSSGDVWFRTRLPGLLLWRDGKLSSYPIKGCTPGLPTESTVEGPDGTIWVGGSAGLFIVGEGRCERVGEKYGLPNGLPYAILFDRAGTLWVKMDSGRLLYLPRGGTRFKLSRYGDGTAGNNCYLHNGPNGSVWLSDAVGLRRVSENGVPVEATSAPDPDRPKGPRFVNFTFDGSGTLWAGSSTGLKRIPDATGVPIGVSIDPAAGQNFTVAQGLSSDVVRKLLVDREGSIWVGTNAGLDQLRRNVISQLETPPTNEYQFAVGAGDHGCVWTGNRSLPLTEVCPDGRTKTFAETKQSMTIRRDLKGDVWSSGLGTVPHLWRASGDGIKPVPFPNDAIEFVASMAVDKNNNLWLITFDQQVDRRIGDTWENENKVLNREPGILGAMEGDEAGNIWFAFSNHVIEWDGANYHRYTFTGKNRYPISLTAKGTHVWLGGEDGVQLFSKGEFHMLRWKDPTLPGRVTGMVETSSGDLWTSGFSGIAHVKADELAKWLQNPDYAVSGEKFDTLDGLPGLAVERYCPSIVEAGDGRLWFATIKGIAWLDPASLEKARNSSPPNLLISSLVWNGETHSNLRGLVIPPHTGRVEIDYTALSLAIPQRVLFRYKLDGSDHDWQDAGTRRETSYTGLGPGHYRFHVIACNNDGVWNETGATLDFSVAPAYYQTTWFRTLFALAFAGVLWALYQLRLRQVRQQFAATLQTRVDERTRIARDLHDTMLQSFQALLLRFQTVLNLLPARPEEAMRRIEGVIEEGSNAITEGRDAVHELRSSGLTTVDLAESIRNFAKELLGNSSNSPQFRVQVEGTPRDLNPVVRDEAYRITAEALRNAIRHAKAQQIEVEIRYDQEHLKLRIRDDGEGIDGGVLDKEHTPGHWGLRGMRERALVIGGSLEIWSKPGSGTEIELKIPAATAYAKPSASHRSFFSQTPRS
jgi:signal transduction histidine kinase/ligand-binding sensor domain-containing protein